MKSAAKHHNPSLFHRFIMGIILITVPTVVFILNAQQTKVAKSGDQPVLPPNPMSGRIVFEEKGCIECHAIDGYGGRVGPDLGRDKFFGNFYDLASRLWNHAPQMVIQTDLMEKQWNTLSTVEMDQLIGYLFYLRYLGEPGNISKGKQLIRDKACLSCHRIGDEGARDGIALDQLTEYASPLYIAQVIWNHGPAMQAEMLSKGITRPLFDDEDITHISAYLRVFSLGRSSKQQFMSPGNPQAGSRLFKSKGCSACHSLETGGASRGTSLGKMNLHRSVTAIAGTMWNHGNIMWEVMEAEGLEWPLFEGSEMADLIAYLYFHDYQQSPGDSGEGRQIFKTKLCSRCHTPEKLFTKDRSAILARPTGLSTTMWNHVPYMRELIVTRNIDWPRMTAEELRHLYAYLLQESTGK